MNQKYFLIFIIAIGLFAAQSVFAQNELISTPLLAMIQEARDNNPQIQRAFHNWKAAEFKIKSVRSLPDPIVNYGNFIKNAETRVGPQEQKFGLSQKLPFPGKLRLKGKAQAKQAEMLKEEYEATKNEVIKEVKFVYYDLFWVDQAIEINEEEKSLLEKLEKVAQRKYESNLVAQQDVIKTQVELSKIIKKLFLLRQNRNSLGVKMKRLLNRVQDMKISKILSVDRRIFNYELDEILERTQNSRQELLAAGLSVERAEYEKSLAKMNYLPDLTFGAEYIDVGSGSTTSPNDGDDAWMGKVSINVPIWFGKLRSQVKEKEAALMASEKNKEDVENRVLFEAQDLYFKITTYRDIILLYETALLPQAEQAFDASQLGFETGSISFLDWLDTERTYLQTRLAYYKAITDYHKSIVYLERVVGEELLGGEK